MSNSHIRAAVLSDRHKLKNRDNIPEINKESALKNGVNWLLWAQERMEDNGMGSYNHISGWTTSYPETTGYIVDTLLNFHSQYTNEDVANHAILAADWFLTIQKPEGGWQSMRIADNKPAVVFNTAQVIRGMIAANRHTKNSIYLYAAIKAGDWLCKIQETNGAWKKNVYLNQSRVYDSYVDAPLLDLYNITGNEKYKKAALANLHWVLSQQKANGWFANCDNTIKRNNQPIIHTIAYTIDGLLYCGEVLHKSEFIERAKIPADVLMEKFLQKGILKGRWDSQWNGSEYFICTGGAQLSICWMRLYKITDNSDYLSAAKKMNSLLVYIQHQQNPFTETKGALQGSFPLWGRYEKFAYPNWATKYFVDALMMENSIDNE